jgi:hypothetical protein
VSSEGFLIRFLLGLAGSLAVLLLAAGFVSSGREQAVRAHAVLGAGGGSGGWASAPELAWLRKLGAWDARLLSGLQRPSRDGARSCEADLSSRVGRAPSARLQRAFETFRRACAHVQRFDASMTLAAAQGNAADVQRAQREARKASRALVQADQLLPPGEVRALPVIAGRSTQSRIEPRFGLIAAALAGKPVEVRCWSAADWPRLMREERSYTHGKLGADTLGFAAIGASRVNLAPAICNGLAALAYGGAPADDASRSLLAAAVVTLSHEAQHSKGVAREAVAECNAIQVAYATALKLGAAPGYAASLVRAYWDHYADELPAYRSVECRTGGKLDLGRADSIWP